MHVLEAEVEVTLQAMALTLQVGAPSAGQDGWSIGPPGRLAPMNRNIRCS